MRTSRLNKPVARRVSLPLTEDDETRLAQIRAFPTRGTVLAEVSEDDRFHGEVSEAMVIHLVFEVGLRVIEDQLSASGYAELALMQGESGSRKLRNRRTPGWAE